MGSAEIVPRLRRIAPVVAVRGNVDREPWAASYREREVVEHEPVLIYVLHNLRELDLAPAKSASPRSSADTPMIQSFTCKTVCSISIREAPVPGASDCRFRSGRSPSWAGNCARADRAERGLKIMDVMLSAAKHPQQNCPAPRRCGFWMSSPVAPQPTRLVAHIPIFR